ncbi:MAG: hypothetical protein ABH885_04060 [Candidatus Omnitrophota bacterium]
MRYRLSCILAVSAFLCALFVFNPSAVMCWEDYGEEADEEKAAGEEAQEDEDLQMDKGYPRPAEDRELDRGDAAPGGEAPPEDVEADRGNRMPRDRGPQPDIEADRGDASPDGGAPVEDYEEDKGDNDL